LFETLTAEIIAIGSELLEPDRTDTNSLWLTDKLNRLGIEVKLKTIVGDDDARLEEAIKDAVRRSKVVITTGGLGPTEDDITRKITARALGRRLLLDEVVLAEIRQRFRRDNAGTTLATGDGDRRRPGVAESKRHRARNVHRS
jgi:nicotinamide-nucleotide amidase